MAKYRNSFHSPRYQDSREWLETDAKPIEYRGHTIYHRINSTSSSGHCWDVVRDGVCIGQYAGKGGAMGFVDRLLDGEATEWDQHRASFGRET